MKIETNADFANWNNSVNHAIHQCDLQDVFARSDMKTLKSLFLEQSKNEMRMSIFSINKCMGADVLLDFLNAYSRKQAESWITEYEADEGRTLAILRNELFHERQALEKEKAEQQNKFDSLHKAIENRNIDNARLSKLNIEYSRENMDLRREARSTQEELDRLYTFENHIKGLLNTN